MKKNRSSASSFLNQYFRDGHHQPKIMPESKYTIKHDKWDEEDYNSILEEMKELNIAEDKLTDAVDTGAPAMADTFFSLLKGDPKLKNEEDIRPSHLVNRVVMDRLMEEKDWEQLRVYSTSDIVSSGLACIAMEPDLEILFDKLKEEQKLAQELQEQLEEMAGMSSDLESTEELMNKALNEGDEGEAQDYQNQAEKIREQMDKLREQMSEKAKEFDDGIHGKAKELKEFSRKALKEAKEKSQTLDSLSSTWGLDPGQLHSLPAQRRIELARKFDSNKFKRIAQLIGPMTRVAIAEQMKKVHHARDEVYDLELGNDISNVLPTELLYMADDDTAVLFFKRFMERELLQYKLRGSEKIAKGGIIYCVDEETEILTVNGWKKYNEITVGQQVLTLNHESGLSEWQPLKRVNIFPNEKREMLHMEGLRHSSLTTKDHRWPVYKTTSLPGSRKRIPYRGWRTSKTLTTEDRLIVSAECATLPADPTYHDSIVKLIGWLWTEGTITPTNGIVIYQSHKMHPHYCSLIREALTDLYGAPFVGDQRSIMNNVVPTPAWKEGYNEITGIMSWHLNIAAAAPIIQHVTLPHKVVKPEFLASLTKEQLTLYIRASLQGDGQNRNWTRIGQAVEERNRSLEMAYVLLGLPVTTIEDQSPSLISSGRSGGKEIRTRFFTSGIKHGDQSCVTLHNKKTFKREWIEHEGIVWCPTTENSTWVARRNGTVYFTGNCEDGSGSMSGDPEIWAKAVGLALYKIAQFQKREFYGIHFGSPGEIMTFDFHKEIGQGVDIELYGSPYRVNSTDTGHYDNIDGVIKFAETYFGSGPLRVDQKIVTPNGWKNIGDIKTGDSIYGPDGLQTKVKEVYPQGILNDLYKVKFKDGAEVICDGGHIWTVKTRNSSVWKDMTLNQIIESGIRYNHKSGGWFNFSVPMSNPIELPEKEYVISPYLMGYLLGDGTLGKGRSVSIHSSETEFPWITELPSDITTTTYNLPTKERCGSFGLKGFGRGKASRNSLLDTLKEYNLYGKRKEDKFIPEDYLWGSVQQRFDVLSGLLDSDGWIDTSGGFSFSNVSEALARGVVQLTQSLGGVASINKYSARPNEMDIWVVSGRLSNTLDAPFRLTRKANLYRKHAYEYTRSIVSVERVDAAECVCIKVERNDGLFLTEGFVVTHNTDFTTPLSKALDVLREQYERDSSVKADIVFCTDGICGVPEDWLKEFKAEQARLGFKVWGILIGYQVNIDTEPLNTICDNRILTLKDLLHDSARTIFGGI